MLRYTSLVLLLNLIVSTVQGQRPASAADYLERGTVLVNRGQLEAAIAEFSKAIELDSAVLQFDLSGGITHRLCRAYTSRGILLRNNKRDLRAAIADFTHVIALNPKNPVAYRERAEARQLQNDLEGAKADNLKAVEIILDLKKKLRPASYGLPDLSTPAVPAGVVAQVNHSYITVSMVEQRIRKVAELLANKKRITQPQAESEVSRQKAELIAGIIKEEFVRQQVERLKLSSEIAQQVDLLIRRKETEKKLKSVDEQDHCFHSRHESREDERERLRTQVANDVVFIHVVGWKVYFNPSSSDVRSYFETHSEKFPEQEFNAKVVRTRMQEEWQNAEFLNEMKRISLISIDEPYREDVTRQIEESIKLASDIPRGEPSDGKTGEQIVGEYLIGCFVAPLLSRGIGSGPCSPKIMAREAENAPGNYSHKGRKLFAAGDLDGAIRQYSKAINVNPEFARAYLNRGIARAAKGDLKKAVKDFTAAIKLEPQFASAYARRGLCLLQRGWEREAEQDFARAFELDPRLKYGIDREANRIREHRVKQP